jgi:hypothetical protein
LFFAAVFLYLNARPVRAVDIPFQRLLLGPQSPSFIDDAAVYPPSYISVQTEYWDVYHEQRGSLLHNYDQIDTRIRAVRRQNSRQIGLEIGRTLLSLEQQNVYTNADLLDGKRDVFHGKILVGYIPSWNGYPLGLRGFQLAGSAGWENGLAGDVEGNFLWPQLSLRVRAETAGNRIELEQTINGFRFPFHFPFRTDRFSGHTVLSLPRDLRLSVWGGIETCHGKGEEVKGFENRLWNRRYTFGCSFDHRLRRPHPLYRVVRLGEAQRPPGFSLSFNHHKSNGDLGMYFNGTRYLHLEDLNSYNTLVRFDVVPLRSVSLFGGWERIRFKHAGNTFADVWPFTVWDAFVAKRYRLDQLDVRLDTSFLGAGGVIERGRVTLETCGRFEWWRDAGMFDWLERYGTPYLFIFKYRRHTVTTDLRPKYAVQLDVALEIRATEKLFFRLSGRGTLPFGDDSNDSPGGMPGTGGGAGAPAAEEDHRVHGGLLGSLELIKKF